MQIREIMTGGVEVIHPDNTLDVAAAEMKRLDIGLLPVCDGNQLVGILTDRDITVRSVAQSEDTTSHKVRDIMTSDVVSCFEDQDVSEVARLMRENQIRRVLVLDRDQRLVGVVSLGDLAAVIGNEQLTGETLERVSDPTPGENSPGAEPQPQYLLSEIKHIAQKVGGWKQLSEIAEALEVDEAMAGS